MRTRLVTVFLVPLLCVLFGLGTAYAWSSARSIQQEFYTDQLGDLSYFVTSARQGLLSGNTAVFEGEADRYQELYGGTVAVMDRSGLPWAVSGDDPAAFDEETTAQVMLALSGRRGEAPRAVAPWSFTDATMVEPVFNDGDVIGAVVLSQPVDAPRAEIAREWMLLAAIAVLATAAGIGIAMRLANWVLRPVQRVDEAMEAIERGDMDARIDDDTGPPELRRMILMFNKMAAEIERVLSRQQEFALNASHELRNPLNALLVRVEFLATGLSDDWEADIEATREEGRRMARILDTLLSLSKRGHGDPALRGIDLAELVERRADAWRDVAAQSGVAIDVTADARVPCLTDEFVVESALDAVIDNAVKFSPPGSVIEVGARHTSRGTRIVVRDHGPGVADGELELLTDRFWRSASTQNVPGSGLGLAIATDLLTSVNGELTIDAAEGGGLQVTLCVSRAVVA